MFGYLDGETPVLVAMNRNGGNPKEDIRESEFVEAALLMRYGSDAPEGQTFDSGLKDWRGEAARQIPDALRFAARMTSAMAFGIHEDLEKPTQPWHERAAYAIVHPFAAMRYARTRKVFLRSIEHGLHDHDSYYLQIANSAESCLAALEKPQDEA